MLQLLNQARYERKSIKAQIEPLLQDSPLVQPATGKSVLLKPNFVMPGPRSDPSTTHPEFYMAVAELMLEYGFRVGIGESPAIGTCAQALRAHGVAEECMQRGIRTVEFKHARPYAGVSHARRYSTLTIAAELDDWDFVVNLPKLKTHSQFTFTAATKNLYGCVTGKRKFVRHNQCANDPVDFAGMLLANAEQAGCVLHICDAIEAMHVQGPRGGKPFPLGKIVVADNHLQHDWLCCRLIDLQPQDTPLFRALDRNTREHLELACKPVLDGPSFAIATGFVHAPLIHISFSPWAIARSGYRRIKHALGGQAAR